MRQIKSKNRNEMADEKLDDSLQLATTNTGINQGRVVLKKPQPQASH